MINFKQLRAFREVMVTGSISGAATNLNRTQPAISAQIANLEAEIGIQLFTRHEGRLQPVPEAQYLFSETMKVIDTIGDIQQNLVRKRDCKSGKISVVSMSGPSMFLLPALISEFVKERPDISISLMSHSSVRTQQLLSAQRYDIGMMDLSPNKGITHSSVEHDIFNFECVCAISKNDPLSSKKKVSAKDLDGKPLATLHDDHSIYKQTKSIFDAQGLKLNRRFETYYFIPQLTFVEQELAYAIVDPLAIASYRLYRRGCGDIVFLPFTSKIQFSVSLVTPSHRPLSIPANAFIAYLKDELLKLGATQER